MRYKLTAIIEKEGEGYAALCPELDVASQGNTVEEARKNLEEASSLFFECALRVEERLAQEVYITPVLRYQLGKLGVFSGEEICKILAKYGFEEVRRRGSHIVMQLKKERQENGHLS